MLKAGRIALCVAGGMIAFAAVVLLGVNMYVQSQGTQERIQQELSHRLSTTLRIQRISVTPWWGLKLSGITIPQAPGTAGADLLQAKTFRLRIQLASLFSERLVIKEISLIEPHVVWAQNEDGKWRLPPPVTALPPPRTESTPLPITQPTSSIAPAATAAAPNAGSPAASGDTETTRITQPGRSAPEIRRVQLRNGYFHFLDAKGKSVARFEGVEFRSGFRDAAAVRGQASIAKTSLRDHFFLENLHSPLTYDAIALDFSEISARAAGGAINGRFVLQPQVEDSPFTATVTFHDLQADRLMADAGGPAGMVTGRIEGRLEANGKTADAEALAGAGEIILRDGVVQQYSLLIALSQLLRIDEIRQLQLEQAHVKFHLSPGVVMIDEVMLQSPNVKLTATGTITFAGNLRLEAQLALDDKIRGRLFHALQENFQPTSDPAFAAVSFDVTGSIDRPKTNLMERLVGRDLKDLGRALSTIFGDDKAERPRKKKKRSEQANAESSPGPTAAAPAAGDPPAMPSPAPTP